MGSTESARRAGIHVASNPSSIIARTTPAKTTGSLTPLLAKHTKHLSLVDILAVGVDRIQRNFEPMHRQVEAWRARQLSDDTAKLVIYCAVIGGNLGGTTARGR